MKVEHQIPCLSDRPAGGEILSQEGILSLRVGIQGTACIAQVLWGSGVENRSSGLLEEEVLVTEATLRLGHEKFVEFQHWRCKPTALEQRL